MEDDLVYHAVAITAVQETSIASARIRIPNAEFKTDYYYTKCPNHIVYMHVNNKRQGILVTSGYSNNVIESQTSRNRVPW